MSLPTTIVYPYSDLCTWEGNELRYSIRSFCEFLTIDRVIVVGHKPEWYKGEHIPFPDGKRKERNIFEKTLEAAKVCDRFIFANDDHFMLQSDQIDYYWSRSLLAKCSADWYGRQCRNTYEHFKAGMFFDLHYPMVVEADKIPTCYDWYKKEYVFKSLYCNHNGIKGVQRGDCKIPGYLAYERITDFASKNAFMSLSTQALTPVMRKWLMERFPEPSPFEFGEVKEVA